MMTNEIEKKFFDAFGIKAKLDGSDFNKSIPANYPEITDPHFAWADLYWVAS